MAAKKVMTMNVFRKFWDFVVSFSQATLNMSHIYAKRKTLIAFSVFNLVILCFLFTTMSITVVCDHILKVDIISKTGAYGREWRWVVITFISMCIPYLLLASRAHYFAFKYRHQIKSNDFSLFQRFQITHSDIDRRLRNGTTLFIICLWIFVVALVSRPLDSIQPLIHILMNIISIGIALSFGWIIWGAIGILPVRKSKQKQWEALPDSDKQKILALSGLQQTSTPLIKYAVKEQARIRALVEREASELQKNTSPANGDTLIRRL